MNKAVLSEFVQVFANGADVKVIEVLGTFMNKFLQDDRFQRFMESVLKVPLDNTKVKLPKDLREDHVEGPTGPEEEDVDDIMDPTVFEEPKFGTDVEGPMAVEEDDIDKI